MEDDPGLTMPQLWAGRMRRDAADSLAYGCTGLMGIHWRTRILGPNVSALAQAAWDHAAGTPTSARPPMPLRPARPKDPRAERSPHSSATRSKARCTRPSIRPSATTCTPIGLSANGHYTVTLKFCEPFYKAKGKRVFGVSVQGQPLVKSLDIFAKVGQNHALDLTMKDVRVKDGSLVIDFACETEFPWIAAIAVEGKTDDSNQFPGRPFSRKINCGGPAYKDADQREAQSRRAQGALFIRLSYPAGSGRQRNALPGSIPPSYGSGKYGFHPQVTLPADTVWVVLPKSMTFTGGNGSGYTRVC